MDEVVQLQLSVSSTCFCLLHGPPAQTSFGPKPGSVDPQPGFGTDVVGEEPYVTYIDRTRQLTGKPRDLEKSKVTPQQDVIMLVPPPPRVLSCRAPACV